MKWIFVIGPKPCKLTDLIFWVSLCVRGYVNVIILAIGEFKIC